MKKKLLFLIPVIIMLVAGYIIYNKRPNEVEEDYYRVNLYETYEIYCNCIDNCDCPTGPKIYKSYSVRKGEKIVKPKDLIQEGRVFLGWSIDSESSNELFDFDTPITRDLNLYAKWEKNKDYRITFYKTYDAYCNCVGECGCPTGPEIYKIVYANDGDIISMPNNPEEKDKTFLGWTTTMNGNDLFDFNTPITSDMNLYTKWK